MFSIGELSRITGLSVKALRLYHEKRILVPRCVDASSGYRYYDQACVEKARAVVKLRELEFSLDEIRDIFDNYDDEADILQYMERHKQVIESRIRQHRSVARSLERMIDAQREAMETMKQSEFEPEEKTLEPMRIAGVRMKGKYSECGKGFGRVCRHMGRFATGKPFTLYYDGEYREDDADFETCIPVREAREVEGISVRELEGGRCVSLLHRGPYEELGRSYERVFAYIKDKGYRTKLPSREVYLKGPGMILKGNPKNYLTEIQIPLED